MPASRPIRSLIVLTATTVALAGGRLPVTLAEPSQITEHPWKTSDAIVRATNRGVALMGRYEYAEAVKAFEEVVKLAPGSTEARVNLAISLYNRSAKGDLETAERLLDEVISQHPDHVRALYFRAIAHQYRGKDEPAATLFGRVVQLAPHDAFAWYLLARSKSRLSRPYRSELNRAIQENPALVSAYYDLMRLASMAGNREEAQRLKEQFLKLRQSPLAETVVMPQYRRMGPLATVQPMSPSGRRPVAGGELSVGPPMTLLQGFGAAGKPVAARDSMPRYDTGLAMADVNGDGHSDLAIVEPCQDGAGGVALLLGQADCTFIDATQTSGLTGAGAAVSCAFGDFDNDGRVDLFVSCVGPNHLFRGAGDGTFEDVTAQTNTGGPKVLSVSAVFLDADHDADLDIYVCNGISFDRDTGPAANQLLNNNADGTFTDIAVATAVACENEPSFVMAPADLDGDRDTDLVVFNGPNLVRIFFNDRLGRYHEQSVTAEPIRGGPRGVVQDFNGDAQPDLLVQSRSNTVSTLCLSDGTATLKPSPQFEASLQPLLTWGEVFATRVVDIDLDGDLDLAILGEAGHVLLNDGRGHFVAKANVWPEVFTGDTLAVDLTDHTGDGVPDLLRVSAKAGGTVELIPTQLTPPANWVAITPTGDRGADKRTRSPASGFGTRMELRCGVHSQVITYTGLSGGLSQSQIPVIFGLNGATKADYLALTWPDGVTQCENELASGTLHRIREMERRVSSCPVLFAWNGEHFGFVGDFAGVGGMGYYVAPGQYAGPQVLEHVKIEPRQLIARNGCYELRLCESMEEVGYIDRLELLAVDHPADLSVYPDEHLTITGPVPTHKLLCPDKPIFPVWAVGPNGDDCTAHLAERDRVYAYQPALDRRFYGFCKPHALMLDFGDRLSALDGEREVYLFITGSIEYPYSQTTYAAAQAGVQWQPMKIEQMTADGRWETILPDAGAPGGMGRTITVNLSGKLHSASGRLRISTNLEIYYDRIFIAADRGAEGFTITTVPLVGADLRRLGFPMEYSPDGRHPSIYTYDLIEPTSSFKMPRGAYTRYGRVDNLLEDFDDRYVILGSGDEIAVSFDAKALPPPSPGQARSFILISHAYCKDMDLYTAKPDTVEPLPFRGMSAYPYPTSEHVPQGAEFRCYREEFNTRRVD